MLQLDPITPVTTALAPWSAVATGALHTCGLRSDGSLWCWGDNSAAQAGAGLVLEVDAPTRIGQDQWRALAAGDEFTCAIQTDDSLWCWGEDNDGQTGTGDHGIYLRNARQDSGSYETPEPTQVPGAWQAIAAGALFACGIRDDGTLWCWGDDYYGELASPDTGIARPSPVEVGTATWTSITAGAYHACGLQSDGTLWCWGLGNSGQLGVAPAMSSSTVPLEVGVPAGASSWAQVAAGGDGTCAIADTSTLYCWGAPTQALAPTKVMVAGLPFDQIAEIEVGGSSDGTTMCARRADASLWCWGYDARGQAGPTPATTSRVAEPQQITGGADAWQSIAVGARTTCAVGTDGSLWCAGADSRGQLGDGGSSHRVPTQVAGTWSRIAAGGLATCALDASGHASCTGSSLYGGIGDGLEIDRAAFVAIASSQPMTALAVGDEDACALDTAGLVWCWGLDSYCQLGDACANAGTTQPRQTIAGTTFTALAAHDQTCAIDGAQRRWCWGRNDDGQTGDTTMLTTTMPAALADGQSWQQLATGTYHACGIAASGTYCWGYAAYGELGIAAPPSSGYATSPQPVATQLPFVSIVAGHEHTCAVDTAGHAWCWGLGDVGQLGLAGFGNETVPAQLPGTWQRLAAGDSHTCGIQSDGSLWCWGNNAFGQLGDGTLESRAAPTPVAGDASWIDVVAGAAHTCATRSDGTLWCWGDNDFGQLGDATAWSEQLVLVH
ncbi:MAG: RCC1 domain-containing protein [Acidobacteriota bacterium]